MIIKDVIDGKERAFYHSIDTIFDNCKIKGEEDGESAFKECRNIKIQNSELCLRYPIWHNHNFELVNNLFHIDCRASLWYCVNGNIKDCLLDGVKAVRECKDITITNSKINSTEFGWKSENLTLNNCSLVGEYAFLDSKNITIKNIDFAGKYSYQYVENMIIEDSKLDTKDAFWHTKNVTVKNSYIKGEYLGWYSENLTLINCTIEGTQPLCYCKNLTLKNCKMIKCDLSFEYSEVNATIVGHIDSIKNPISGFISAESIDEIIKEGNIYNDTCKIKIG